MLAGSKRRLHAWPRGGSTGTARGAEAFLVEALHRLPTHTRVLTVRADSGFDVADFPAALEERDMQFAGAARIQLPLRRAIGGLRDWRPFGRGAEVSELPLQPPGWPTARRRVVVREVLVERPEAAGRQPAYRTPRLHRPRRRHKPHSPASPKRSGASMTVVPTARTASKSSSSTSPPTASACPPSRGRGRRRQSILVVPAIDRQRRFSSRRATSGAPRAGIESPARRLGGTRPLLPASSNSPTRGTAGTGGRQTPPSTRSDGGAFVEEPRESFRPAADL